MFKIAMQRRHFQLIAVVISQLNVHTTTRQEIAQDFANALTRTNPQFNRERFIKVAVSLA